MKTDSQNQSPISVVLVDDHQLLRGLLAQALELVEGIVVKGQAGDAEEGVELCRNLRPDVVVLDAILPGQQGPDSVEGFLRASPRSRILMCSGTTNPLALRRALAAGARGFVPKSAPLPEMVAGIRSVHTGQIFCGAGSWIAPGSIRSPG